MCWLRRAHGPGLPHGVVAPFSPWGARPFHSLGCLQRQASHFLLLLLLRLPACSDSERIIQGALQLPPLREGSHSWLLGEPGLALPTLPCFQQLHPPHLPPQISAADCPDPRVLLLCCPTPPPQTPTMPFPAAELWEMAFRGVTPLLLLPAAAAAAEAPSPAACLPANLMWAPKVSVATPRARPFCPPE